MASLQGTKDTFLWSCPFLNTWSVPNRQKCAHNANKQAKAGYRIKHPMIIGQGSYKNPYPKAIAKVYAHTCPIHAPRLVFG